MMRHASILSFRIPFFIAAGIVLAGLSSCATPQVPFHGFPDAGTLESHDRTVMTQSASGGPLDPMNLAQEDQRYTHDNIAYDRVEEGYYQWGARLYAMGYRDEYYVRDLAPKAFGHEMMDTYDHDIAKGFEDAAQNDSQNK